MGEERLKEKERELVALKSEGQQADRKTRSLEAQLSELKAIRDKLEARVASLQLASDQKDKELKAKKALTPQQEQAVKQFAGWEKVDADGRRLPARAPQYAAVIDQKTKLMWAINPDKTADFPNPAKEMSWHEAQDWLKDVNRRGWCGHKDWRLPTLDELKTLLLPEKQQRLYLRRDVFTDVSADNYWVWTSSPCADDGDYAWIVYFHYGNASSGNKNDYYFVRVVRSGQ